MRPAQQRVNFPMAIASSSRQQKRCAFAGFDPWRGRGCSDDVMLATPGALVVGGYAKINSSAFISLPSLHAQVQFTWRTCS